MDIVVKNQQTEERQVFKQIDSQLAAVLIAAGIAVPYAKPVEVSSGPTYSIGTTPTGLSVIIRSTAREKTFISNTRAKIQGAYPDCPANILDTWDRIPDIEKLPPLASIVSGGTKGS